MKVTVIPIVIGALGTIPKGLVKRLEDLEVDTIQTTELLRSARILAVTQPPVKTITLRWHEKPIKE